MGQVNHIERSGYFPFCLSQGTPPDENLPYLALSLERAMAFFWRVKNWNIKVTGGFTLANPPYMSLVYSSTVELLDFSISPGKNRDSEESIVCWNAVSVAFEKLDYPFTLDGNPNTGLVSFAISEEYFPAYQNQNFVYLPVIIAAIGVVTNYRFQYPPYNAGSWAQVGSCNFNFLGQTDSFPIYLNSVVGTGGSVNIEINAQDYWSYGGTYNTATGEKL